MSGGSLELIQSCAFAFALITALHWAPWTAAFGKPLHPIAAYLIGVGTILSVFTLWMLWMQPAYPLSLYGLWAIAGTTGFGVLLAYLIDKALEALRKDRLGG